MRRAAVVSISARTIRVVSRRGLAIQHFVDAPDGVRPATFAGLVGIVLLVSEADGEAKGPDSDAPMSGATSMVETEWLARSPAW